METTTTYELPSELDYRESDGIQVWLLWHPAANRLTVRVVDAAGDDSFELPVDAAEALDVFEHPYAYAAFRGVPYELPAREPVGV